MTAPVQENEPRTIIETTGLRRKSGIVRLFAITGITLAALLPIGVVPRVLQSQELDGVHTRLAEALPVVSTVRPQAASPFRVVKLPGTVEAVLETPVFARTSGYVKQRFADIGDRVKAGQLLAEIETPEVNDSAREAQAQVLTTIAARVQNEANIDRAIADVQKAIADLAQAKATLVERQSDQKFAATTYARYKTLVQQGAVSEQDGDEKETRMRGANAATEAAQDRVRAAEADVVAAKARLRAEKANLGVNDAGIEVARAHATRLQTEKGFQHVSAPFTGVITERNVDPGSLVTAGSESSKEALFRLARIDTVKVFVDVPQYASSAVHVGQNVSVALKELPGKTFSGRIARTSVALDPTTRTMRAEVHIANAEELLAPGMYAEVNFEVPRTAKMFLIPSNAVVVRSAEGPQVVTVEAGVVSVRKVQLGEDLGAQMEIVGGLTGTETVVVNPRDTLSTGTKVQIAQDK